MLEGMIPYLCRATKQTLLLVILLVAVFSHVSLALAQAFPPGSSADPFTQPFVNTGNNPGNTNAPGYFPNISGSPTGPNPNSVTGNPANGGDGSIDGGLYAGAANAETQQNQTEELPPVYVTDGASCWNSASGFFNCLVVGFFGSLVAIAGYTFDSAISLFIVGFGDLYINAGIGYTVENVWTTIRDVFNLTFIFGLVYIGFQIILGTNESGAKRTIPFLILAALLVNFSLFIVKFIIDFANLAAVQVFNLFTVSGQIGDQNVPTKGIVDILTTPEGPSLALAFLNTIGVSGLLNHNAAQNAEAAPIIYMFVMIIIFLVLTYVFFAGAILITVRFAVLIFYMIFSPIMFLGWVFPGMKSYSDKFWNGLFGQAFFAPALLFMLYISYKLAQGFNDGQRTGVSAVGNDSSNISAFASFMPYLVVVVIFLLGSLIIAKKMANQGADMVGKVNDWGINKLKGAMKGTGYAAAGAAGGVAGSFGYKNIDKMANSDNRFARTLGRTLTYAGVRDKAEKAYKGSIQGQWKETRKKRSGEMANRGADARLANSISTGLTATPGSQEQINFERSIQNANQSQLIDALKEHSPGTDGYNRIVRAMSHAQVKGLLEAKNDVFNSGSQASLRSAYTEQTAQRMTVGTGNGGANRTMPEAIARGSAEDLAALGLPLLTPHAYSISAARMDDLRGKLTPTEHQNLNASRTSQLVSMLASPVTRDQVFSGKSDREIARLPREVLLATDANGRPYAVQYLNRNALNIMMQGNSNDSFMHAGDRAQLRALISSGRVVGANITDMNQWFNTPQGAGF